MGEGQRTQEGVVVFGSKTERYVAPEPAGGTSYWIRRLLKGPMISREDGVLLRPKVVEHPAETTSWHPAAPSPPTITILAALSGSISGMIRPTHEQAWDCPRPTDPTSITSVCDGQRVPDHGRQRADSATVGDLGACRFDRDRLAVRQMDISLGTGRCSCWCAGT
jgi:hypothetical protein